MSENTNTNPEDVNDEVETEELEDEVEETEEGETEAPVSSSGDSRVDRSELNKVIKQRQDLKRRVREAEKKLQDMQKANETESEKARREAAEEAAAQVVAKYKPALVKKSAEKQLLEAGVKPNKINRLIKLMDMDEIDVDDELNVEGVSEEVDRLQEEFPELFQLHQEEEPEEKPRRRRAPKVDSSDKPPAPPKKSTTDILWEGLSKGRR